MKSFYNMKILIREFLKKIRIKLYNGKIENIWIIFLRFTVIKKKLPFLYQYK